MKKVLMGFLLALLCTSTLMTLVLAKNQSGFLSIDCGLAPGAAYTDPSTGINYISDSGFIDSGVSNNISAQFRYDGLPPQFINLRSFPQGTRNCYIFSPPMDAGSNYLLRARFMYGNYDFKNKVPSFDLYFGANWWDSVKPQNESTIVDKEIIYNFTSSRNFICLVNIGLGTPFISALEFRLLNSSMYATTFGSLSNLLRVDLGAKTDTYIRYKDDIYDRIWAPLESPDTLRTLARIDALHHNIYQPPSKVMQSAITSSHNKSFFTINLKPDSPFYLVFFYMHFTEIEVNTTREFNIYINGDLWYGPLSPKYLYTNTIFSTFPKIAAEYNIILNKTENSSLPPIMNALEIYAAKALLQSSTNEDEVNALLNIKSLYKLKKNWEGDPCVPKDYLWEGINCSYSGNNPPSVIFLNLSSNKLSGEIAPYVSNLTMMRSLDLSDNNLTGSVPDVLAQLPSLSILILTGNNFTSPIPKLLIARSQNGSLLLRVDANLCSPQICLNNTSEISWNSSSTNNTISGGGRNESSSSSTWTGDIVNSSDNNEKKIVVPVVASVAGVIFLLAFAAMIFWWLRKRKQDRKTSPFNDNANGGERAILLRNRHFTYAEILAITNNLEREIGKGRNGKVFHGLIENTEVAVKICTPTTSLAYSQFQTEAEILLKVRHGILASLIGYCCEESKLGHIYEYVPNGSLKALLSVGNMNPPSWERRLLIAIDVAQGLEYLHYSSEIPMIHGNVKPSNILLDEDLHAKLVSFGLSRVVPSGHGTDEEAAVGTHSVIGFGGTYEYLDPDVQRCVCRYFISNLLDKRSDVFSFGVVLLEMIAGRPAGVEGGHETHIAWWVISLVEKGEMENIADAKLRGNFETNSMKKAIELALACVSLKAARRPNMNDVVLELKECLLLEMGPNAENATS